MSHEYTLSPSFVGISLKGFVQSLLETDKIKSCTDHQSFAELEHRDELPFTRPQYGKLISNGEDTVAERRATVSKIDLIPLI